MDLASCSASAFFLPEDPWFLDCDEVCLVAVLVAVCSVFVEEVVHLKWVGNGNKSWHRTADFFSAVLHAQLSNFPLLSEKFLVLWFKIASGERGFIACEKSCWSQVVDRASPAVCFQLLPALKTALLEPWAPGGVCPCPLP